MTSASVKSVGNSAPAHWTDREVDEGAFKDARLGQRFRELLIQLGAGMGESIPLACQDWANTRRPIVSFRMNGCRKAIF